MGLAHRIGSWIHSFIMMTREEKKIPIIIPTDKDKLLTGRVALITGGSSGIGMTIAERFADSGAKVIIAGRDMVKLNNVVNNITSRGAMQKHRY